MFYLEEIYHKRAAPKLQKAFGYSNVMQVPRFQKAALSICVGQAVKNPKLVNAAREDLTLIAGQRAVITKAKKAVANFKLREGTAIGAAVTLRRGGMWSFLERLIHFALPQVRDFKGLSPKAFDGRGNYNMGLREQIVFPEINYDTVDAVRGMNITLNTTAATDEEAKALMDWTGFPFRS